MLLRAANSAKYGSIRAKVESAGPTMLTVVTGVPCSHYSLGHGNARTRELDNGDEGPQQRAEQLRLTDDHATYAAEARLR